MDKKLNIVELKLKTYEDFIFVVKLLEPFSSARAFNAAGEMLEFEKKFENCVSVAYLSKEGHYKDYHYASCLDLDNKKWARIVKRIVTSFLEGIA